MIFIGGYVVFSFVFLFLCKTPKSLVKLLEQKCVRLIAETSKVRSF